ncbi:hypothetical protein [Rhizobium sp. CSW-27]|uniref:hypothetical protein n=1 Tax=Rhizobium sp. CSW-27 TaxID=2839985 RepID=UPI001C031904|nr:hypothetical protein [Rhizobium sp. CSW-27]MBT9373364.1 hypothetical protein [Rhizobium sp. CSW-27]
MFSIKQTNTLGDCPIAIDLNGNERIDITGLTATQNKLYSLFSTGNFVRFDVFGDGTMQEIDWITSNTDGLIVEWDAQNPKTTLTGRDLMGFVREFPRTAEEDATEETYRNGYEKLASFDEDHDGEVSGEELKKLAVWIDNGNAQLEPGEILSFDQLGITSLHTSFDKEEGYYGFEALRGYARKGENIYVLTEDIWFLNKAAIPNLDLQVANAFKKLGF